MSGTATLEQIAWVTRVLNVAFGDASLTSAGSTGTVSPSHNGASKETGGASLDRFALQQARDTWAQARGGMAAEISAFKQAIRTRLPAKWADPAVANSHRQLDEILKRLDTRLLDALDTAIGEPDPARAAQSIQVARDVAAEYAAFASSSKLLRKLAGKTPFPGLTLSAWPTCDTALKSVQASLSA